MVVPVSAFAFVGLPTLAQSTPASPVNDTSSVRPAVVGMRGRAIVGKLFHVFTFTSGVPEAFGVPTAKPSHCVTFPLTTPLVKSSCPVPVPLDSNTLAPISRAVCAVPLPVGPTFTALASARPAASTTSVRPGVAGTSGRATVARLFHSFAFTSGVPAVPGASQAVPRSCDTFAAAYCTSSVGAMIRLFVVSANVNVLRPAEVNILFGQSKRYQPPSRSLIPPAVLSLG